ncbi:endolytic transglycosylase MltG, partial [Stenotrophomonas maltophilia]
SGVFVRRLKLGMRLQTDPTVIYGMGANYKGNITREDLRTPTPYNTYTINGLPPTPIALPSQKAIEAALHPDDSNNIYFVATGNGGHKFTADLQAHN